MSDLPPAAPVRLGFEEAREFARALLAANGLGAAHAAAVARSVVRAQADDCQSHGLYRLIGYVASLRSGKAEPQALPELVALTPAVLRVEAKKTFAPLAIETGLPALADAAKRLGIAALAINDCYHFSALWADVEPLVEAGLIGFAFTVGQNCVAPAGGAVPVFGTNPMAFGWPRPDGSGFIFDFATSASARGEIELKRRAGERLPEGWAVGPDGVPTTDPAAALAGALLPFGGHKGSALALMVELIAGPLIGDLTSAQAKAAGNGDGGPPLGGELILALDPKIFGRSAAANETAAEAVFAALAQPGVRLPGERRLKARARSHAEGIEVPAALFTELQALMR